MVYQILTKNSIYAYNKIISDENSVQKEKAFRKQGCSKMAAGGGGC